MATPILSSIIILLTAMLHQTSGCSCVNEIQRFCNSDYAIRGTITGIQGNATVLNEDVIYSVQVEEVYRNTTDGIVVNTTINIDSPGHTCGIGPLDDGTTYLISGVYDGSEYSVDVCNSVVVEYNDPDDDDDLGIPCSASMTTTTSYAVIVCALLHLILH